MARNEPDCLTFGEVLDIFASHPPFQRHGFTVGWRRLELLARTNVLPPASGTGPSDWLFDPSQLNPLMSSPMIAIIPSEIGELSALVIRHTFPTPNETEVRTHMGWNETWTDTKKTEATRQYWPIAEPKPLVRERALLIATVANYVVGLWRLRALDATQEGAEHDASGSYYLHDDGTRRRAFDVTQVRAQEKHPYFHAWIPDFPRRVLCRRYPN